MGAVLSRNWPVSLSVPAHVTPIFSLAWQLTSGTVLILNLPINLLTLFGRTACSGAVKDAPLYSEGVTYCTFDPLSRFSSREFFLPSVASGLFSGGFGLGCKALWNNVIHIQLNWIKLKVKITLQFMMSVMKGRSVLLTLIVIQRGYDVTACEM